MACIHEGLIHNGKPVTVNKDGLCDVCASQAEFDRRSAEIQTERELEEIWRQEEMTAAMDARIDADRARQRQRNIDYYRDRGLPVPNSCYR